MSSGKSRALGNMHVFVPCQIDSLNNQLVSPLNWNKPFSETSLDESYILTIYKYLDVKKKHFLNAEKVFNI